MDETKTISKNIESIQTPKFKYSNQRKFKNLILYLKNLTTIIII